MNQAVLARLRRSYARRCEHAAQVLRGLRSDNGIGGGSTRGTVVEEALRANVSPLRQPREGEEGGRPVVTADYEVYLGHEERAPDTFAVQTNDVIFVAGGFYTVVTTDKGRSAARCLVATCKRTG